MDTMDRRPPAFVVSAVLGVVGVVLFLVGVVTGTDAAWFAGLAAGALSLAAALFWRSQLVEAWHKDQK